MYDLYDILTVVVYELGVYGMSLASIQPGQLSRLARQIASSAMTIELATDRGDWEAVQDGHGRLIGLYKEYRATYKACWPRGSIVSRRRVRVP